MPKNVTETEPDGIPNALNEPLSNTQFNVLYHLALAYYLKGDYAAAAGVWSECLDYSPNPDLLVATTDWLWMTLMRLGRNAAATALLDAIRPDLEVIENDSYLRRLRMYRGELAPEDLISSDAEDPADAPSRSRPRVMAWPIGTAERRAGKAAAIWASPHHRIWSAFGYIAARTRPAPRREPLIQGHSSMRMPASSARPGSGAKSARNDVCKRCSTSRRFRPRR